MYGTKNANFEKFKQGEEISDNYNNSSNNNMARKKDNNAQLFDEFDDENNNNNKRESDNANSMNILRKKNNQRVIQNMKQDPQFKNPPKNPQEKTNRIKTIIFNYIKERELDM